MKLTAINTETGELETRDIDPNQHTNSSRDGKLYWLTAKEVAAIEAEQAELQRQDAEERAAAEKQSARQALLEQLLDKVEADPTVLDRIK